MTAAHTLNHQALQLSGSTGADPEHDPVGRQEPRSPVWPFLLVFLHPLNLPGPYSESSAGSAWSSAGVAAPCERQCVCALSDFSCVQLFATLLECGRQRHPDFAVQGVPSMVMGPTSQRMAQYRPEKALRK